MSHLKLHDKFLAILRSKQAQAFDDPGFDVKEHVIKKRYSSVGIASDSSAVYHEGLRRFFVNNVLSNDPCFPKCDDVFVVGTITDSKKTSHRSAIHVFQDLEVPPHTYFFEQGFLASTHSWLEANQSGERTRGCLSYVFDDLSHYFMADYPCRLIHKLNSDASLDDSEIDRARCVRQRIVAAKISKYNSQSICLPSIITGKKKRVLVCDQAYRDASTIYGRVTDRDFELMLQCALDENPDSEIVVKTHPDVHWAKKNKRTGFYTHLESHGRIKVMRETCNPYVLFEAVDKVYVATSQMGLEALCAGKEVVVFGSPFYAGWGLTDDRSNVPYRFRERSIDEVFYYFYIWYTLYLLPDASCESSVEDVLDYIELNRPVPAMAYEFEKSAPPSVSVIVPVYNTANYLCDCIDSILRQTFSDFELIIVNDESPDESRLIIDNYANRDVRIRSIEMPVNVGLGFARNAGIDAARGEFIFFLDSDDMLASSSVLDEAVLAASVGKADLVRVQKLKFADARGKDSATLDPKERHFSSRRDYRVKNGEGDLSIFRTWHCWNFLYRKSLLDKYKIRFITRKWEERSFICKALYCANKVSALPIPGVLYRVREDSISNSCRSELDLKMFLANVEEVSRFFDKSEASLVVALQFAKTLISGAWKDQLQKIIVENDNELLLLLQRAFSCFHLSKDNNLLNINELSSLGLFDRHILLFVASLRIGKWDFAQIASERGVVDLKLLFKELILEPVTPAQADFQYSLGVYSRNEFVSIGKDELRPEGCDKFELPTVVVHFGSSKTGSTYIQNFMEANKATLLSRGIWFPEIGLFTQTARPHKQAGHVGFIREAIDGRPTFREYLEEGLRVFSSLNSAVGQIHTIVLSSEAFYLNRNSVHIARYLSGFRIKAVGYFRRQDDWANSQYAEFVAGGAVGRIALTFDEWIKEAKTRQRLNYFSYLELWADVIGRNNITARVYDRANFVDGDIVNDFFATIGQSSILKDLDSLPANLSNRFPFSAGQVEYLRIMNKRDFDGSENYLAFMREVEQELLVDSGNSSKAPLNLINRRQREDVLELVRYSNERLFDVYLNEFPVFSLPSGSPRQSSVEISMDDLQKIEGIYMLYNKKKGEQNC